MGITGLLQMLKPIQKPASISEFYGQVVGVDAYCWLHKGVYGCAMDLMEGKKTTMYVNYILRRVNLMLHHEIKPILVFDGGHLPSKADKEKERRSLRKDNKAKGLAFLRAGNKVEAVECFQRCVDITPEMALDVIKACRAKGVDCVVAPYEADAQLAYLYKHGIIHLVVSEDSDLLIYGCRKVLYKMDASGNGTLIDLDDLPKLTDLKFHQFSMEKFRHMCILSGCDYLPSVKGIGLITANKLLRKYSDVWKLLRSLKLGTQYSVSQEYVKHFKQADETFLYQTVFDPQSEALVPLTTIPEELQSSDLQFAGPLVSKEVAIGIALGNIDPISGDTMADFDQKVISLHTLNASSEETGGGGTRTSYHRHSLTPRPATSWNNSVMYGKGKSLNIQKNLGGLMMEFEPSELARKPFVPPQMTRKDEGKCEEDSLDNDQLADMYTSLKPKPKSNKSTLLCSSASNRKLPIRRSRFQNPFRVKEDHIREQRNNQVSRYFKFCTSSSHPEKEDHPQRTAVCPAFSETNMQDCDNATENGFAESHLDPGATLSRLSSNMPRLPCFVSCLEQDNEQNTFDRDSEDKENLSWSTSSGSLDTSSGMTTENFASPRSRKRKYSDGSSDCCSAVINHSDDNTSHGTPEKHVTHCDGRSDTGMPNVLKASVLPVRKQFLQESNALPNVNLSGQVGSDTKDTKLCGHKVNLLTHFGYRRSNSRLQEEERPSATCAESKNVSEIDSGYLSDEEESIDSDETASHLSSGSVSLTQSGSHPVHIDLSQDTEDTTSPQYSLSGSLQKGNSAETKTVKRHIQLRAKTGAVRSTGLGRCRSMGITKKTPSAAQRTPATPNTPSLFNYFEYSKRNMNK